MKKSQISLILLTILIMFFGAVEAAKADSLTGIRSEGIFISKDGAVTFDARDFDILESAYQEGKAASYEEGKNKTIEEIKMNPEEYGISATPAREEFTFSFGSYEQGYLHGTSSYSSGSLSVTNCGHKYIHITYNNGCSLNVSDGQDISNISTITIRGTQTMVSPDGYSNATTTSRTVKFYLE